MKVVRTAPLHELVDRFAESIVHLTPDAIGRLLEAAERAPAIAKSISSLVLSTRERQVYDLVVQGSKNADVSTRLGISLKTVQTHRAKINKKLGAHSTTDLVRIAASQGIL